MVYQLTLTGLVLGSTITVFEAGTTNVLAQSIDHGSTSFVYTYSDGGFNVRIVIGAVGYAQTVLSIAAPSADTTLPVSQTVDRSLLIPVSAAAAARKAIDAISPAEVEALIDDLGPGVSSWNDLLDKPSSFPPSPHKSSHATGGSDALTPGDIGAEAVANRGQPSGYASLDSSGQIPAAQIPSIAVTEFLGQVASQSAMLALVGQRGDWCVRTDTGTAWIITGTDPAILAGWTQFVYPAAPVSSVAGRTGAVTLSTSDVSGLGNSATRNVGTTAGTVAAGDDSRLSDSRAPTGAASGDLGGTYPSPTVTVARGLRETDGPTSLAMGAVADGQPLVRVGAGVQGMSGVTWDDSTRALTFSSGTITASAGIRITQTFNNSGAAFIPFDMTITRTAAASGSALMRLTEGGSIRFQVDSLTTTQGIRIMNGFGGSIRVASNASGNFEIGDPNGGWLRINSLSLAFPSNAASLLYDSTNVTSLVGVTPTSGQTFRVFNTRTNSSNGEWLDVSWSSNRCTIEPRANGTGTVRPMVVRHPPVTLATLPSAATAGAGARSVISDSSVAMSGNFGAVAAGGGSHMVPVISDGTDWRIG